MSGQSALVVGATGQTGRHLLQSVLSSPHFTRVGEYGRRVTPSEEITTGKDKLEQKVINFEEIEESRLKDGKWDVVFITLGTTRAAAGSDEAFDKIDREYVIRAAKEAKNPELTTQRLVYCSAGGADSTSRFLYNRSKGLAEEGLAALGYADTIFFRPGFLAGAKRDGSRSIENVFGKVTGLLSHFSNNIEINVATLGRSMYLAGKFGSQNLPAGVPTSKVGKPDHQAITIGNSAALKLAETKE